MSEEDDASKTEDPTDKKLSKARDKGQVAQSQEIKSWGVIMGGLIGLIFIFPGMMRDVTSLARPFIESPEAIALDGEKFRAVFYDVVIKTGIILAPVIGLLMLLAIAATMGQVGLIWAPKKLEPELSKLSMLKNAKQKVSLMAVVEFLKGILKMVVVGVVAFGVTLPFLDDMELIPGMSLTLTLERMQIIAIMLVAGTIAVMTVISVLDFAYQKFSFTKSMKMTKQEVKDEHKAAEGDPQVKARIRKLRMERFQQRMMASVPDADVVVTNPTHYAIALKYKMDDMQAPKLVAKGMDSLAFRIKDVAEENDIPIVENPPLARALYATVEVDDEIPMEHYQAVAEVIGYVMRLRGELPPDSGNERSGP